MFRNAQGAEVMLKADENFGGDELKQCETSSESDSEVDSDFSGSEGDPLSDY